MVKHWRYYLRRHWFLSYAVFTENGQIQMLQSVQSSSLLSGFPLRYATSYLHAAYPGSRIAILGFSRVSPQEAWMYTEAVERATRLSGNPYKDELEAGLARSRREHLRKNLNVIKGGPDAVPEPY